MPKEIEAKMRIPDPEAFARSMTALAGPPIMDAVLGDRFHDTVDGTLRQNDCGLRVRTRRASGASEPSAAMLTYKGPRQPGAVKVRDEIETPVADAKSIAAILAAIGYAERIGYEKRRRTWRIGECRVELDEVPLIGDFVEIEGPDEPSIADVRQRVGLAEADLETRSYIQMLSEYLNAHGMTDRHVPFTPAQHRND